MEGTPITPEEMMMLMPGMQPGSSNLFGPGGPANPGGTPPIMPGPAGVPSGPMPGAQQNRFQQFMGSPGAAMMFSALQNLSARNTPGGRQQSPVAAYQRAVQLQHGQKMQELQAQRQAEADRRAQEKHESDMKTGGAKFGTVNPRDYTEASLAKFRETGDFNDLERHKGRIKIGNMYYETDPDGNVVSVLDASEVADVEGEIAAGKKGDQDFAANQEKFFANKPKLEMGIQAARDKQPIIVNTVNRAKEILSQARGAGWEGFMQDIPATYAKQLGDLLSTLKSNVAFQTLQDMRAASPTGGALGAVSAPELELLMNNLGSLSQTGDANALIATLDNILSENANMLMRMEDAYQKDAARYGKDTRSQAPEEPNVVDFSNL